MIGIVSAALMSVGVFGLGQPALQSLKLSPRLAALVRTAPCGDPEVATLGYREPSLIFLEGTDLDMVANVGDAAAFLARPGCRVALVDGRVEPAFRDAVGTLGKPVEPLGRVAGFNINGGRRQEIGVYAVRP